MSPGPDAEGSEEINIMISPMRCDLLKTLCNCLTRGPIQPILNVLVSIQPTLEFKTNIGPRNQSTPALFHKSKVVIPNRLDYPRCIVEPLPIDLGTLMCKNVLATPGSGKPSRNSILSAHTISPNKACPLPYLIMLIWAFVLSVKTLQRARPASFSAAS